MSKKKIKMPFSITYDAPVTLTFAFVSLVLFLLDAYVFKQKWSSLFLASPTMASGEIPFALKDPLSYVRVLFYAFGGKDAIVLISNLIFILLLGPGIEEKYGTVIIGIMMVVAAIFAGVLNSCFRNVPMQGATSIVFMMIFLSAFMSFSKKKVPLSFLAVFIFYIVIQVAENKTNGIIGLIINIAGGLCGSLFAFLASPKAKVERKSSKATGLKGKAEILAEFDDSNSPRFKKNKKDDSAGSDDETVVGTLKF